MNTISNVNAIHIVRCSWCNRLGHELTNCPSWIGCIAHEREKQKRLKERQESIGARTVDLEDGLDAVRGVCSGLVLSAAIYAFVGYLVMLWVR
jgi:hypothetical protein